MVFLGLGFPNSSPLPRLDLPVGLKLAGTLMSFAVEGHVLLISVKSFMFSDSNGRLLGSGGASVLVEAIQLKSLARLVEPGLAGLLMAQVRGRSAITGR